jgi:hypothetical protein
MAEKDLREAAQLEQRDTQEDAALGRPVLLVAYLMGEPNAHGFNVRGLRIATAEDVKALTPKRTKRSS